MTASLRLTWAQPEDLIGHELRQASEDGRDATDIALRRHTAGGRPAPARTGASVAAAIAAAGPGDVHGCLRAGPAPAAESLPG
ncbi:MULTISPECIES: hypothetical protein [unclassified Streptomyces]|uniref:hypothetical protein n=1 Tax=unclassified Streptomyces TaxID=2593676 RepID=UPI0037F3372A